MSKLTLHDEMTLCGNCGITFLWPVEEQLRIGAGERTRAGKPPFCPGCRRIVALDGRERGLVKWYNGRRRYGFIVRHQHPDLFVHGSHVEGSSHLRVGDLVEFNVEETQRGPAAVRVRKLFTETNQEAPTPETRVSGS